LAESKAFQRSATGLARAVGPITAVLVTIGFVVGWGWQRWIFQFPGHTLLPENLWFAGIPPAVMAFIIGGIIVLIMMMGYSILISGMPRSCGGYVAISRSIGPFAAFIGSALEFVAVTQYIGFIATGVFEISIFPMGPAIGIFAVPASYNDVGFFAGGLFLVALFTAIVALSIRMTGFLLHVLVWVPVALGVYVLYLLGVAILNPVILQNGISVWAQAHGITGVTADTYVQAALTQGLDSASVGNYWIAVSVSLLGAYFAYFGYAATTFVAGEVKHPEIPPE
jgi:amino acid transporter